MMMAALPQLAILPVLEKVDYDPVKDFTPISNVASNPFCLVANPEFEAKTLQELVAYVKARPGKLSYASGGTGSVSHLTMVLFLQRAGLTWCTCLTKAALRQLPTLWATRYRFISAIFQKPFPERVAAFAL